MGGPSIYDLPTNSLSLSPLSIAPYLCCLLRVRFTVKVFFLCENGGRSLTLEFSSPIFDSSSGRHIVLGV